MRSGSLIIGAAKISAGSFKCRFHGTGLCIQKHACELRIRYISQRNSVENSGLYICSAQADFRENRLLAGIFSIESSLRAGNSFYEARGPAARCPLCRSGTTKALFRPSATVDSQCRDFVPFCCTSGNRPAHLCASSSATQGWLTTTQPEPSNLGIHCVTPSHIRKPEEGKGTGAICGRAAEASAKEILRPAQKSDARASGRERQKKRPADFSAGR